MKTDVQWFRSRFNECFEKAEYAKGRMTGDIPDSAMLAEKLMFDRALEMVRFETTSALQIHSDDRTYRLCARQSRAAAVSELMGDTPAECEIAYDTALWMLFAILDDAMQEGEAVEEEDKTTIQNCESPGWLLTLRAGNVTDEMLLSAVVKSIQGRLEALRRKMRSASG